MTADGTQGAIKAFGEPTVGHGAQQLLFGVLPTVGWANAQPLAAMCNCATLAVQALG